MSLKNNSNESLKKTLEDKKVLITGGTGSVGQIAVHEILRFNPAVVRILDVDETREFEMKHNLKKYSNVRFLLGDIRDKERLKRAVEDIDIIFHFASLKHVLACEYNPMEAVKTNVMGTQNLIDVALDEEVDKVIFTSSDKAVSPCNVLGATKLLAEKLITAANYYKGQRKTIFCSVRFGNVMGSRGSILPLFKDQIQNGGPVTLTDEKMTRFVMSVSEASALLLSAASMAQGGEIFVPKMHSVKIIDLACALIEELNPHNADAVKINVVGRGPGEKLFEEIMTQSEAERSLETEQLFIILPEITEYLHTEKFRYSNARPTKLAGYKSEDVETLTKQQIKALIHKENLLQSKPHLLHL
jgi:FlaA1/EpsC-like NDP-sugar epimerase